MRTWLHLPSWDFPELHRQAGSTTPTDRLSSQGLCYLGGAGVEHGRGEDGHDGGLGVQDLLLQHGRVLLHAPLQRDIIVLGPAPQGVQQEHGVLVAPLQELAPRVLHEQGVPVVHGVAQLEGEDGIWKGKVRGSQASLPHSELPQS